MHVAVDLHPEELRGLEILKEAIPQVARVAIFRHPPFAEQALPDLLRAGEALKLKLEVIEVSGPDKLRTGFQAAKRKKAGAILLLWSPMFYLNREQIATFANDYRLPIVSSYGPEVGAFLSYGIDLKESERRACSYADRLLKGAVPSDLPVEEVSTLRLRVDLRIAKAMGITIPDSVLARADEVVR